MTSDRWQRLEELYHEALARPAGERAAFLAEACKSDSGMRREVETLLAERGDSLDRPAWEYATGTVAGRAYLNASASLGPYRITGLLGAGGMGEVYAAVDTRLKRKVAVKVLPEEFRRDHERKQRFDREAHIISRFNHPHICTIHDVGSDNGLDYLVMEYLEGDTLAARLAKGRLGDKDVLRYAIQVASALTYAHREGVTHRDLKPANIMLTKSGAKLLDFGLARSVAAGSEIDDLTQTGVIVGTAQYMAPEQVEGRKADTRTDVFAFGAVVYEMATGRRAFEGESRAAVMSAILREEPPRVSSVNASLAPGLDQIVQTCLAKDPDTRWQSMHDVQVQLEALSGAAQREAHGNVIARSKWREWVAFAVAGVAVAAAAILFVYHSRRTPMDARSYRFQIAPPEKLAYNDDAPAVSPDGTKIAFTVKGPGEPEPAWVRPLDGLDAVPIRGTEGAYYLIWSPDARAVAFFAGNKLKKADVASGTVTTLADVTYPAGATWNRQGTILFSSVDETPGSLYRVSDSGGESVPVLAEVKAGKTWPSFLPDGRHFLFVYRDYIHGAKSGIYVGSVDSPDISFITAGDSGAIYAKPGYIVFIRDGRLVAQRFDDRSLSVTGERFLLSDTAPAVPRDLTFGWAALYSGSETGVLAFRTSHVNISELVWYGRDGKRMQTLGQPGAYTQMTLSPDSKHVTVERLDERTITWNLWMFDTDTGIFSRLTSGGDAEDVIWSDDSRDIYFGSERTGIRNVYRRRIGETRDAQVYADDSRKVPESWIPGNALLYTTRDGRQLYRLPLSGQVKPTLLPADGNVKDEPHVSPDGRLIAYGSPETGRWEVYVASFPDFQNKVQVSKNGGGQPLWRGDAKELFFLSLDGALMAVDVDARPLRTGLPKQLFTTHVRTNPFIDQYGVSADGRRFLMSELIPEPPSPITVVVNWPALLSGRKSSAPQ